MQADVERVAPNYCVPSAESSSRSVAFAWRGSATVSSMKRNGRAFELKTLKAQTLTERKKGVAF
jgi:hypothetical protein